MGTGDLMLGVTLMDEIPNQGGVEILLVTCYRHMTETGDERRPNGQLGSHADCASEYKVASPISLVFFFFWMSPRPV